jgi:OmpA-OmpF porin, OOP family
MRTCAVIAFLFLCVSAAFAQQKDLAGCKDAPYLSRFPGSAVRNCKHLAFESIKMPLEKGSKLVEGESDVLFFVVPPGHSREEVKRNFSNAFASAGFTVDYDAGRNLVVHKDNLWVWASVQDNNYTLTSVREKAMQQQVVASAKELQSGINATGHIVANGIFFDTDKAELKPESKPALDEIAKLLKDDPGLRIYVVGHTDNQGNLAHNLDLSKARAASVAKALESQYGIAAPRLASYGDGPYAPVASNESEDGRAKNRRVELVKQ